MENSRGDVEIIRSVGDHIQKHIGEIAIVFHEKVSTDVHIDVYHVAPSRSRPFHTLISCGMSERSMSTPADWEDGRFAELMICLPASWPVDATAFENEEYYWPIRILKGAARYPHDNKTWLYAGHSVLWRDPPQPFASNTKMASIVLRYPRMVSEDSRTIQATGGKHILLWAVVPLYVEEWEFKNRNGFEALDALLLENGITELPDPKRTNVGLKQ
jgi:hypothetical protein